MKLRSAPHELQARIDQDLKEAMKAREASASAFYACLKAALKNAVYREGGMQFELTEPDALAIVRKEIKKRRGLDRKLRQGWPA